MAEDFGTRLRKARERAGMTPYRLAQETGLSKQGALNLEQPGADPKLSTIVKLAEALGVPPWELLPGWQGPRQDGSVTLAVYEQVKPLIEELYHWGKQYSGLVAPGEIKIIAHRLERIFGEAIPGELPRRRKK